MANKIINVVIVKDNLGETHRTELPNKKPNINNILEVKQALIL